MPLPLLVPLALAAAGTVGKMFGRGKANRQLESLLKQEPQYQVNPLAQERLNLTKTLLNARMPGSAQIERNLFSKTANQVQNIENNATDSSQALALASGAYGNLGSELTDLGTMEAQDYQRRYGNYAGAEEQMIGEGDKAYQDKLRRYQDLYDVRGAQQQNRQAGWGDISNLGFSMMNFGLAGGFNGLFNGRNTNPIRQLQPTGTYGYGGYMSPELYNRRTPNFR